MIKWEKMLYGNEELPIGIAFEFLGAVTSYLEVSINQLSDFYKVVIKKNPYEFYSMLHLGI